MNDCIFCKIIDGSIPSKTIYEDEIVKAFLDINPLNPGHTLIIPKKHYKDFDDIDLETLTHIMKVAKELKLRIEDKLNPNGVRLLQNNGVLVLIVHIVPPFLFGRGVRGSCCRAPSRHRQDILIALQAHIAACRE